MPRSFYLLIFVALVSTTASENEKTQKALIISVDESKPEESEAVISDLQISEQSQAPSYQLSDRAPYTPQGAPRSTNSIDKQQQLGYILVSPEDLKRLQQLENVSVEKPKFIVYGESPDNSFEVDSSDYSRESDNKNDYDGHRKHSEQTGDYKYPHRPAPPLLSPPSGYGDSREEQSNTEYRSPRAGPSDGNNPPLTRFLNPEEGYDGRNNKPSSSHYSTDSDSDGPYLYAIFKTQKPLPFGPKYYSAPKTPGKGTPYSGRYGRSNTQSKSSLYDKPSTYNHPSKPNSYDIPSSYSGPSKHNSYSTPSPYSGSSKPNSYDVSSYSDPKKSNKYDYPLSYSGPPKSLPYEPPSSYGVPSKPQEYIPPSSYSKGSPHSNSHDSSKSLYNGPSKPSSYNSYTSHGGTSKPDPYNSPHPYKQPNSYDSAKSYNSPKKPIYYENPTSYYGSSKPNSYEPPISHSGPSKPSSYESHSPYNGPSKHSSYDSPSLYSGPSKPSSYDSPPSYSGPSKPSSYDSPPSYSGPSKPSSYDSPSSYSGPSKPSSYDSPSSYNGPSKPSSYDTPSSYSGPSKPSSYDSPSSYSGPSNPYSYDSPSSYSGPSQTSAHNSPSSYSGPSLPSSYESPTSYSEPSLPSSYESPPSHSSSKPNSYGRPSSYYGSSNPSKYSSYKPNPYGSKTYSGPPKTSSDNYSPDSPYNGYSKPDSYETPSDPPYGTRSKPSTYNVNSHEVSRPESQSGPTSNYKGTPYRDYEQSHDHSSYSPSHYDGPDSSKNSGYTNSHPPKDYDGPPTSYFTVHDAIEHEPHHHGKSLGVNSDKREPNYYHGNSEEDYHSAKKNYKPMRPAPLSDDFEGHGNYPPLPGSMKSPPSYSEDDEDNGKERDDGAYKSPKSYGSYHTGKSHSSPPAKSYIHKPDYHPENGHAYHPSSGESHSYYHPDHSSEESDGPEPNYHIKTTTTTISKPKFETSEEYAPNRNSESTFIPSKSSSQSASYSSGGYHPSSLIQQTPYSGDKGRKVIYYTQESHNKPELSRSPESHKIETSPPKRVEGVVYRPRKSSAIYRRPLDFKGQLVHKPYNPQSSSAVDHKVYENPPAIKEGEASTKITETVPSKMRYSSSKEELKEKRKQSKPNAYDESLEDDDEGDLSLSAIPGDPGKDYPILKAIPHTSFSCFNRAPGFYADIEHRCQVYYQCSDEGRIQSFLCPNGTIFNQASFVCEWWHNVDCSNSEKFFGRNKELYKSQELKTDLNKTEVGAKTHRPRHAIDEHRENSDSPHYGSNYKDRHSQSLQNHKRK